MTDVESGETSLTVRRTFDASRERLYRAFTDPDELAQWYAPGDMTAEVDALEPEVDGRLAVSMLGDEEPHEVEGTFTEVVENERLVHTWRWTGDDAGAESRVTVEFRDVEGGTEVTLTHEALPGPESVERHAEGWSGILENLSAEL
jgi:uncharacterized protein YndB with AHSA1/START domain